MTNKIATLLSLFIFIISAFWFCLMTLDVADYGMQYWTWFEYSIYVVFGATMVVFGFATVLLNIKN